MIISTHALTEGDIVTTCALVLVWTFQLTPSRRATNIDALSIALDVFQLTPSRRATSLTLENAAADAFQLTPSRRATMTCISSLRLSGHFNSRPHGGRLERGSNVRDRSLISTHALTEGDPAEHGTNRCSEYFNSRPHGGRPGNTVSRRLAMSHFNSRPHGGRRGSGGIMPENHRYFNSRPHGGRRNPAYNW